MTDYFLNLFDPSVSYEPVAGWVAKVPLWKRLFEVGRHDR